MFWVDLVENPACLHFFRGDACLFQTLTWSDHKVRINFGRTSKSRCPELPIQRKADTFGFAGFGFSLGDFKTFESWQESSE